MARDAITEHNLADGLTLIVEQRWGGWHGQIMDGDRHLRSIQRTTLDQLHQTAEVFVATGR